MKANPRLVGAFVVGGVALVIGGLLLLSGGRLFSEKDRFSVFFPGSVSGLNVGAPVTFRGIKIGNVVEVTAFFTGEAVDIEIEVVLEIDRRKIKDPTGAVGLFGHLTAEAEAEALIDHGMRATLETESLITGQRYVQLDFNPEKPARFVGLGTRYPELPTTTTAMEELGARLDSMLEDVARFSVKDLLEEAQATLTSIRTLVDDPDLRRAIAGVDRMATSIDETMGSIEASARKLDETAGKLEQSVVSTSEEARSTLETARSTLETLERSVAHTAEMQLQTTRTLEEVAKAAESIRVLIEYLEQHPEALIQGKAKARDQ